MRAAVSRATMQRWRRGGVRRAGSMVACVVLVAVAAAYYFSHEPAPQVLIRWRDDAALDRQEAIARRFGLRDPHEPQGRGRMYDLLDTRPENIRELLEQPEIDGSGYIDEQAGTVSAEALPGRSRTWIGQRLVVSPELRVYRVVPVVITMCATILAVDVTLILVTHARWTRRRIAALKRRRASRPHPGPRHSPNADRPQG